jgi:hypothetical protein
VLTLLRDNGVDVPLRRVGSCQYGLGAARAAVRLVNARPMVRSGAGAVDLLAWLARQPVAACQG